MMGAAMLKCHQFVQSLWGWLECVRGGVRRSPCNLLYKRIPLYCNMINLR